MSWCTRCLPAIHPPMQIFENFGRCAYQLRRHIGGKKVYYILHSWQDGKTSMLAMAGRCLVLSV